MAVSKARKNSASYKLDVIRKRLKRAVARLEKNNEQSAKLQYLKNELKNSYVGRNNNPNSAKQILSSAKKIKIPSLDYNVAQENRKTNIAVEKLRRQSIAKEGSIESIKNHIFYRATQHIWQNANVLPSERNKAIEEYFGMNLEAVYEKVMRENSDVIKRALNNFNKVSDTNDSSFNEDNGDISQNSWYAMFIASIKIAERYAA